MWNLLKNKKNFYKRKHFILVGVVATFIVGGASVVYAADTNISSHGEILFDNETIDTSDDVFFSAADFEMLNGKIDGTRDTIDTLQSDLNEEIDKINSNLGGNIIIYDESEDAYYIQHGADSVPKKLGKSSGQVEFVVSAGGKEEHWSTVSFQNIDEKTLVIKSFSGTSESDSGNSFYKLRLSINYKDGTSTSDYIYDSTADTDSGHASVNQTLNWEYEIKNASSVTLSAGTRGYGDRVSSTFTCAWE